MFRNIDDSVDLTTTNALSRAAQVKAIRSTISHLYLAILFKEVATDSEEVNIAFDLFMDVLQASVDTGCNTGASGKARDVREAWYAVVFYLLSDYRFVYS